MASIMKNPMFLSFECYNKKISFRNKKLIKRLVLTWLLTFSMQLLPVAACTFMITFLIFIFFSSIIVNLQCLLDALQFRQLLQLFWFSDNINKTQWSTIVNFSYEIGSNKKCLNHHHSICIMLMRYIFRFPIWDYLNIDT